MNVAKMVTDYLATLPTITAKTADRIYWGRTPVVSAPDPTLRVSLINGNRLHNLDYASPDIQVSAFAKDLTDVEALKEAVIDALRDRHGLMGTTWVTSVYQSDQTFAESTWWHSPIMFGLRLQEG